MEITWEPGLIDQSVEKTCKDKLTPWEQYLDKKENKRKEKKEKRKKKQQGQQVILLFFYVECWLVLSSWLYGSFNLQLLTLMIYSSFIYRSLTIMKTSHKVLILMIHTLKKNWIKCKVQRQVLIFFPTVINLYWKLCYIHGLGAHCLWT